MKKIFVTGVGGYIGSITAQLLLSKGYRVVGIDNYTAGYKAPLYYLESKYGKDNFQFYHKSTHDDLSELLAIHTDIDGVIHFAANTSVPDSIANPDQYFYNNLVGSQLLMRQLLAHNLKKIIFSSTAATFGDAKYTPIDEKHPQNPTNPYGLSKYMVEQMLDWYDKSHGMKFIAFRYFNVTGASDDAEMGDSKNPSPHLVQNAVRGALGIAPFVLQCGTNNPTPDGTPVRDYVNVVDLAEAHILGMEYLLNGGKSQKLNLGTGEGTSVLDAVKTVERITGRKIELATDESRAGEDPVLVASSSKAHEVLGWQMRHTLEDSVKSLVAWYTKHPHGWEE